MRNLRNGIIEVLNADYVDFARAKGLRNRLVLGRHVLRNALISTVTLFGLNIGTLLGGAVITEIGLRHSRRRPADDRSHLWPRLSGHPGADPRAGDPGLAGLPRDRYRAGLRSIPGSRGDDACRGTSLRAAPAPGAAGDALSSARSSCSADACSCAFFPGAVAPYDPLAFDYNAIMQPPSLAHPFGTDNFGRDVLSRVIWATRIDMQIARLRDARSRSSSARWSARWSAIAAAGSRRCSAASSISSSPFPSWCWSSPSSRCSAPASSTCISPSASSAGCSTPS